MSFAPVGDLARHLMIRRHTAQIKSDLDRLSEMMAGGRKSDVAAALRGNLAPLNGLETSLARLQGWSYAANGLSTRMEAMQSAMSAMRRLGENGANSFLHAQLPQQIDLAAGQAAETLTALLGHLNTRVGDVHVFAGTSTNAPAVGSADDLLAALLPEIAGLNSPEAVADRVLEWMRQPSGFSAVMYRGGTAVAPVSVSEQEQLAHGITAENPGFSELLAAAALGALLDRGLFEGDIAARRRTTELTAERFLSSATDSIHLAGRLGQSQERLARVSTHNAAEQSALMIARNDILRADPEQTAAELTATSTQLELLFAMTARLSSLTLLNALR